MLAFLKWLVTRLALVRWLFKVLGGLGRLVPLAFVLKLVGLPVLGVLGVLALPVLLLLLIFGLPIFLVLLVGGAIMGLIGTVLAFGLLVLKIALVVVVPIWLLWTLASWISGRGGDERWRTCDEHPPGAPPAPSPPPPPPPPPPAGPPPEGGIAD